MQPAYTKGGIVLENYSVSRGLRLRLGASPLGAHMEGFAVWLQGNGSHPKSIARRLQELAQWTDWLVEHPCEVENLATALSEFRGHLERQERLYVSSGGLHAALRAAKRFVEYLRERGVIPAPPDPGAAVLEEHPLLAEYERWIRQHRGLRELTLTTYRRPIAALLDELGHEPVDFTAGAIREFVLERAPGRGPQRMRVIAAAVRSFLRFLGITGRVPVGLERSVPHFPGWKLTALPGYLMQEDVEKVIEAADVGGARGLRNRAMLLLLSRLGLRSSELAELDISCFDWERGQLAISGKGGRRHWLPLPQEVGDAVLEYLRKGRPRHPSTRVFLCSTPPIRPLTRYAVKGLVRLALQRTSVSSPSRGAHILRHSLASSMLRRGLSLASVGAILRHRDPSTTLVYAKVDIGLLSTIAQPWPEVEP